MNREQVEKLSSEAGEPSWLLEKRLAAFEVFDGLELPKEKDEPWRYTDFRRLRFNLADFELSKIGTEPKETSVQKELRDVEGDRAGYVVQRDAGVVFTELSDVLANKGVILTSLDVAIREHPDLVKEHLFSQIAPESGYFSALNAALFTGGTFLYVPSGVQIEAPIESQVWIDEGGAMIMPRSLVIVEDGASVEFFERLRSGELGSPSLSNSAVETVVGDGAHMKWVTLQEFGSDVWHFETQKATVGSKVDARHLLITLGGRFSREEVETTMAGERTEVEMLSVYFAEAGQHFDFRTLQEHAAPNCRSDLLYKGALKDEARAVYSGMIRVDEGAAGTDAYQANRNLVLSDHAKADSKPELEILNNDVRCTHGVSVGQINPDEVYYLLTRGIERPDAERLIVNGFFEDVVSRIDIEEIREEVTGSIARKLEGVI